MRFSTLSNCPLLLAGYEGCQCSDIGSYSENDFYTASGLTYKTVLTEFVTKMQTTPFYSAASNFFSSSISGGSCPSWSVEVMGMSIVLDQMCSDVMSAIFPLISAVLISTAAFVAFRWAFL